MSSHLLKKNLFPLMNGLMFLLSIGMLVVGMVIGMKTATGCGGTFDFADVLIYAGLSMTVVSLAGLFYSCCCSRAFWIYQVFIILVITSCFIGVIFSFVLAGKGSGTELPGKAYKEYKLGSYSKGMQSLVKDPNNWNQTKTCMIKDKICTSFNIKYLNDTVEKFYKEPLTPIQSGCCKPSNDCGFSYRSPTNWSEEKGVFTNRDCKAWDNDAKVLCFNCESCKAGVADHMRQNLMTAAIIILVFLIIYVILFIVACCAFKTSSRVDDNFFDIKYRQ